MHIQETTVERFNRLPLPAAHLVVDIRGASERGSIDWLRVELEDLGNEMKSLAVPRWRAVSKFLSFLRLPPNAGSGFFPDDDGEPEEETAAALFLERQQSGGQESGRSAQEELPFIRQKEKLVQTIEQVAEQRARAMQEVREPERQVRGPDARVRVLFLVDLACQESLISALLWAKHLKNHYRKQRQPGGRPELCVALVCLGDREERGKLGLLLQELDRHQAHIFLDTLILSENYRQCPPGAERAQAHIAAQLLYALLLFFSPTFTFFSTDPSAPLWHDSQGSLAVWPAQTYVVHIAALEYSARWGRRWLNHGLARTLIDLLHPQTALPTRERIEAADLGISWFRDWLGRLRERMPLVGQEMAGLPGARRIPSPAFPIFVAGQRSRRNTLQRLERYLNQLAETYGTTGSGPSLQHALLQGRSLVMQALSQRESGQESLRSLQEFQREARQIFGASRLWGNGSQPLARAPFFLQGLAGACADLQREYMLDPLNPQCPHIAHRESKNIGERRQDLLDGGQRLLHGLASSFARWPGLTGFPLTRRLMQYATFAVQAALAFLALFLLIALLHHLALEAVPGPVAALDRSGVPWLDLAAVVLWSLLVAARFKLLRARFACRRASDIARERKCLLYLALLGSCGFLTSLELTGLAHTPGDQTSVIYLAWFSPLVPVITGVPLLALAGIILGEAIYLLFWSLQLRGTYQRIVRTWQQQQQQDARDVLDCIARDVALEIAQQAGLCDRNGGPGSYFYRVNQLAEMLSSLSKEAQQCRRQAAGRLSLGQDDAEQRNENAWIRAHLGSEELDMDVLVSEYKELHRQITRDCAWQRTLAEYLLRAQGTEPPEDLQQAMREQLAEVESGHRPLLRLLFSLLAFTVRNILDPLPMGPLDLSQGDYRSEQKYIAEEMPALQGYVQALNARTRQVVTPYTPQKRPVSQNWQDEIPALAHLLALVTQMFWQQKGGEQLKQSLAVKSIWEHLERNIPAHRLPETVRHRLNACVGNGARSGPQANQYLLAAPLSHRPASRDLEHLLSASVIDIPDRDRLLLFGIRRVGAR